MKNRSLSTSGTQYKNLFKKKEERQTDTKKMTSENEC